MWDALELVSSGVTLVAFVVAVGATIFLRSAKARERLIKQAEEGRRAELVRDALEFFRVDATNLTRQQQFEIALEQIRARASRFKVVAISVCFVAVVAAAVTAYAVKLEPQTNMRIGSESVSSRGGQDTVDRRVRGFLGKENLPVPGTGYPDGQLVDRFSMTRSPVDALGSGTILSGPFPFYSRSIQGDDVYNESRAFFRGNTVTGIAISQSCSMQMIEFCRRSRREWADFLRNTLVAGDTKTIDVGLPNGPGRPITQGITETYTVLDDPWRAELIWAEPKSAMVDEVQVGVSVVMTIARN